MKAGFRVYDAHSHLGKARHSGRVCDADTMLARMDSAGIDRALLIPFPVVDDVAAAHDEIAAAVRAHPGRFTGCACIPPYAPNFADEVRRCAQDLGFRALKLQPQFHGLNPLSARNAFFFEAAAAHNLVLVVHTGAGAPFALPSLYIPPARRYPELRIVLGHAGGAVYAGEAIVAAGVCPNIFIELSTLMPHHVREVMEHVPASRLMIGSDLPESVDAEIGKITALDAPHAVRSEILWRTARGLFDGVDD